MTVEEVKAQIPEIEKDITYFTNLGFEHLTEKFKRDLECVKSVLAQIKEE